MHGMTEVGAAALTGRASVPSPDGRSHDGSREFCAAVGRAAITGLYDELVLYPKPGLVSLIDNGSHDDMTAETFFRSLFSLRHYFVRITAAGMEQAPFHVLKQLGIEAEARMLEATNGVNTHRGAIFALGLLCAAAGLCQRRQHYLTAEAMRSALMDAWGADLIAHTHQGDAASHGLQVARLHAASGAREEAACGMPSVFELALPVLQTTFAGTGCWERARIEAFFALMSHISDTNVYYRGGPAGAAMVKQCASAFITRGGTSAADWKEYAIGCHLRFVEKNLSPGGAADLLGVACFVFRTVRRFEFFK